MEGAVGDGFGVWRARSMVSLLGASSSGIGVGSKFRDLPVEGFEVCGDFCLGGVGGVGPGDDVEVAVGGAA